MFGLRRCVRIACEPIPWSGQGGQTNEEKQQPISEPSFFVNRYNMRKNKLPKGLQKGEKISGKTPLGAPLDPKLVFDSKSEYTAAPKWSQGPKKSLQVI